MEKRTVSGLDSQKMEKVHVSVFWGKFPSASNRKRGNVPQHRHFCVVIRGSELKILKSREHRKWDVQIFNGRLG